MQASTQTLKLAQGNMLESQYREGKIDSMIGMRVFTVNKNKGWQSCWLLRRNAPCSHLSFFAVSGWLHLTLRHQHSSTLSLWLVWIIYLVPWQGWPQQYVCGSMLHIQCLIRWGELAKLGNTISLSTKNNIWRSGDRFRVCTLRRCEQSTRATTGNVCACAGIYIVVNFINRTIFYNYPTDLSCLCLQMTNKW